MPSVREICRELGFKSTSTAHRSIARLVDEGLLEKQGENLNRAIRLRGDESVKVPILGTVTAGQPITAVESIEGYLGFRPKKHYDGRLFALKVRGESMINAAILDGDTVIVEQRPVAGSDCQKILQGKRSLPSAARERLDGPDNSGRSVDFGTGSRGHEIHRRVGIA